MHGIYFFDFAFDFFAGLRVADFIGLLPQLELPQQDEDDFFMAIGNSP